MSGLSGPGFFLTLFGPEANLPWWSNNERSGRLSHVGVTFEEIEGVEQRATGLGCPIHWRAPGFVTITDQLGVTWELGNYRALGPIGRRHGRIRLADH